MEAMNSTENVTDTVAWGPGEGIVVTVAIYDSSVTALSLLGNCAVLYLSIQYDALQLDAVSLFLVQNLAVADILFTSTTIFPIAVTATARRYVLGDVYCFVTAHLAFIPTVANILTILAITSYRLRLLTPPYKKIPITAARIAVALIWLLATSGTIASFAYGSTYIFDDTSMECYSSMSVNAEADVVFTALNGVFLALPLVIIIVFSVILSVIAIRHSERFSGKKKRNYRVSVDYFLIIFCAFLIIFAYYLIIFCIKLLLRKVQ